MKKLFFSRALATLLAVAMMVPFQAVAAVKSPAQVLPKDTIIYMDLNLQELPGDLGNTLINLLNTQLGSSDVLPARKIMLEMISGKRIYLAMSGNALSMEELALVIPATQDQWTRFLAAEPKPIKKMSGVHEYYLESDSPSSDTATYLDGYFIVTSSGEDYMKKILQGYDKGEFLSTSSAYSNTAAKLTSGNFFTLFGDITKLLDGVKQELSSELGKESAQSILDIYSSFKEFAYGFGTFDKGVKFEGIVTKGPTSNKFSTTPFLPTLYKKAPAKNPLLYYEGYNLKQITDVWSDLVKSLSAEFSFDATGALSDALGFDLEKNLLTHLSKGFSVTIDPSTTEVPYITLMADVKGNEQTVQASVKKIIDVLGGNIDPLQITVTNDGVLLLSNDEKILTKYGTGIDGTDFGMAVSNPQTTGLVFVDLQKTATVVKQTIESEYKTYPVNNRKYFNLENILSRINVISKPWSRLVMTGYDDGTSASSTVKVFVAPSVYAADYWQDAYGAYEEIEKSYARYASSLQGFDDVPAGVWYSDSLQDLKVEGIIKGYENYGMLAFRPGQNVTRAEFLAMLYRGVYGEPDYLEKSNSNFEYMNFMSKWADEGDGAYAGSNFFKDLESDHWAFSIVTSAAKKKLIKGYGNHEFRPNQTINRAEAVAMAYRFYEYNNDLEIFVDLPFRDGKEFPDVAKDAWYAAPTDAAYRLGIVDGNDSGKFEPGRSLNRAEAAQMIHNLLRGKF